MVQLVQLMQFEWHPTEAKQTHGVKDFETELDWLSYTWRDNSFENLLHSTFEPSNIQSNNLHTIFCHNHYQLLTLSLWATPFKPYTAAALISFYEYSHLLIYSRLSVIPEWEWDEMYIWDLYHCLEFLILSLHEPLHILCNSGCWFSVLSLAMQYRIDQY